MANIKAKAWNGQVIIEAKEARTYLTFDEAVDLLNAIDKALGEAATHPSNAE